MARTIFAPGTVATNDNRLAHATAQDSLPGKDRLLLASISMHAVKCLAKARWSRN